MNKKINVLPVVLFITTVFFMSFSYSGDEWTKTELYFGLSKPDAGYVTDEEFNAFVDSVIARSFYEGFTVISSNGGWYDSEKQQTIFESSRIVIHYSNMNEAVSSDIDSIRAKYKRYFNQQSVLRVDQIVEVKF